MSEGDGTGPARGACAVLERLLEHHYRAAASLSDVPFEQATSHPFAGRPSIAWCLGHLEWCLRTVPPMLGAPGAGALPPADPLHEHPDHGVTSEAAWEELRARFRRAGEEALSALAALDDRTLELPPARPIHRAFRASLTTRERFLLGHAYHVAYHCGQIGSLRAALGSSP